MWYSLILLVWPDNYDYLIRTDFTDLKTSMKCFLRSFKTRQMV